MEFNSRPMEVGFAFADKEAYNLYEITENLEEYYRQKAPNLWNAWIRTNNMLVEQQERLDKQGVKLNNLNTTLNNLNKKLDFLINQQEKQNNFSR
ncbi:MAG: hypothetical protein J6M62_07735 [Selenomonadaceae bacterium]|nr:hypothetical protein [Selenomonadaceae bacterium]